MPKSVFTDAYVSVTELLRELRLQRGMTQVELAQRLGKPQQFVSKFERGDRRLDVVEFYAVVRAVGADPHQAFAALLARLPENVEI